MQKKKLCSFLCSVAIVTLEVLGCWEAVPMYNWGFFMYYTHISNILLGVASLFWVFFIARDLRDGIEPPMWVRLFKYIATCMTTLTLLLVAGVLAPARESYLSMFLDGSFVYFHTVCPLLALLSLLAFEGNPVLKSRHVFISLIPTVIYGIAALIMNLIGQWEGPYPFLLVYEHPVWMTALFMTLILLGAWGIAAILRFANAEIHREYIY